MIKTIHAILDKLEGKRITYKGLCQNLYKITAVSLVMVSVGNKIEKQIDHDVKAHESQEEKIIKVSGYPVEKEENEEDNKENKTEGFTDKEVEVDEIEAEEVEETYYIESLGEDELESEKLDFALMVIPQAIELTGEYGLYPSVMVAQAILESDWGKSDLAVDANNLFGIKGSYEGKSHRKATLEDDGTGNKYEIVDSFAKYPSTRESLESNAKLLAEGLTYDENFYKGTWVENSMSYKESAKALTGTYATDIEYSYKLIEIIERYKLNELDYRRD